MKRAVITGATGCVGRNLVDVLLEDGWEITALHRKTSDIGRLKGLGVTLKETDLHDLESVRESVPVGTDAIFHVAANVSHWAAEAEIQWKDNVLATRNLVKVALENGVKRFIFTSTGATLGLQGADEKYTNATTKNGYIRTKRLSELEIFKGIESGLDAVILQPIIVMGRYDYNNYSQIFKDLKTGKLTGAFPGRIAFCHARDVAKAHLSAFERGRCGENYVLGGEYTTWLDAFQRIAKVIGANQPKKELSKGLLLVVSYIMSFISFFTRKAPILTPDLIDLLRDAPDVSFVDKRKAKETLGYESASLDEMIADCYDWLSSEGRI